ncbi:ABC transporter permease [Kutzneria chonburiensis]|uniref:ABC transporter permease n=1 Tax=Kutzneria chonburiensis TaxID=1483604 RepID=A0ABV6MVL0_9PSEU|nr:ABC transporter permease [Kutzneria chonburiensis]
MSIGRRFYRTATGFELIEHARNRLAIVMVAVFIPVWITLIRFMMPENPLPFRYRGTGEQLHVNGQHLTFVSGGLNAATLIVGFLMFSVTHRSGPFDRRLVAAGYPRPHLLAAKVTALFASSVVVGAYATAMVYVYWQPEQLWLFGLGMFTSALTYGGIGIVLGTLLHGELEGMFAIIMISLIDVGLESPVVNAGSDNDLVQFLPMYGSMQAGVGAGFTHTVPWTQMAALPVWWAVCSIVGLIAFHVRTRVYTRSGRPVTAAMVANAPIPRPAPGEAVHVTVRVCGPSCVATDHMPMYQGLAVLAALSAEQAADRADQNVYPLSIKRG